MNHVKRTSALLMAMLLIATAALTGCGQKKKSTGTNAVQVPSTATPTTIDVEKLYKEVHPMVWKVTKGDGPTVYLFATTNTGNGHSVAMLEKVKSCIDSCDIYGVEIDNNAFQLDNQKVNEVRQQWVYKDKDKVNNHLSSDMYSKASQFLAQNNNNPAAYDSFKAGYWLKKVTDTAQGNIVDITSNFNMDKLLSEYIAEKKMEIVEAEDPIEYHTTYENFSDDLVNMEMGIFFKDQDKFTKNIQDRYEAWAAGDEKKCEELFMAQFKANDGEDEKLVEEYTKALCTDRNKAIASKVEDCLKGKKDVFFAVDVTHLLGSDSVRTILEGKDCTLEQMKFSDEYKADKK